MAHVHGSVNKSIVMLLEENTLTIKKNSRRSTLLDFIRYDKSTT